MVELDPVSVPPFGIRTYLEVGQFGPVKAICHNFTCELSLNVALSIMLDVCGTKSCFHSDVTS